MPREIQMEQNLDDESRIILDDPFIGADPNDEEDDNAEADFGNDLDTVDDAEPEADEESEDDGESDEPAVDDLDAEAEPGDGTDEAAGTPPVDEPAADDSAKDQRIPKQRFDEVNDRRKAAEKKLADYEAAQAAAKQAADGAFDFDAKETEYMELVVDGEFAKANAVRQEIRAAERAENEMIAVRAAANAREATKADLVFQDTVTELEAMYPQMDTAKEGFDQSLVDEVLSLHEGFLNQGLEPTAAIRKAVKYVAKLNDLVAAGDEPAPAPTPVAKPARPTDVQAKAKAKTSQPQQLPKASEREPSLDLESMSEDEFDALPESKKRELRGDFI